MYQQISGHYSPHLPQPVHKQQLNQAVCSLIAILILLAHSLSKLHQWSLLLKAHGVMNDYTNVGLIPLASVVISIYETVLCVISVGAISIMV